MIKSTRSDKKPDEPEALKYPRLMERISTGDVILVTSEGVGIYVDGEASVGTTILFTTSVFKDYHGSITLSNE